jgi:sialidase-1
MEVIKKISEHIIYKSSDMDFPNQHAKFPGVVQLDSGRLIAMYEVRSDIEFASSGTYLSWSDDHGVSWHGHRELYDYSKLKLGYQISETFKPTVLKDGKIIAIGYRFHRKDPKKSIGNPMTGGLLPGDNVVCFSEDNGESWTLPEVISHDYPELLEISGPCIELKSGELVAVGCPFKIWDGASPSGQIGIVLISNDKGVTWDSRIKYFTTAHSKIAPWEGRVIEMQPGRLVAIVWAYDFEKDVHLPNYVAVSHDGGHAWQKPFPTNHLAQASNIMWLGGNLLLSIHSHRADEPIGIFVRIVDFTNDKWRVVAEEKIWGNSAKQDSKSSIIDQFVNLKFGQPSLLRLHNGDILATHWCAEDGCPGKIITHRLKINIVN